MITFKDFLQMSSKMSRTSIIDEFIKYAQSELQIESLPSIDISNDTTKAKECCTYGMYNPAEKTIWVYGKNRNLGDVLRTLGHEMVHHRQQEEGRLYPGAGAAGTDIENEANQLAAVLLRAFGKSNTGIYESVENH